jgi:hypothetical protein
MFYICATIYVHGCGSNQRIRSRNAIKKISKKKDNKMKTNEKINKKNEEEEKDK